MNPDSLMQNPALSGIDPGKLQLLLSLASQAGNKKQNELLPFLMSAAGTQGKQLSFQPSEIDSIVEVLKFGKSPQEIQQIDRACALMRQFRAASGRGGSPQNGN